MAYNYPGALRAAIGMGGLGLTFGPIGAGIGALAGLIAGTGKTDIQRQEDKLNNLLAEIRKSKATVLDEGTQAINRAMGGALAQAAGGGTRRAAAAGRTAEAEGLILPAQAAIAGQGVEAQRQFIGETEAAYEQQMLDVERMKAGLPLEPGATDILSMVGEGATEAIQMVEKYNLEKKLADQRKAALAGGGVMSSPYGIAKNEQLPDYAAAVGAARPPAFTGIKKSDVLATPEASVFSAGGGINFEGVDPIIDTYRRARMADFGDPYSSRRRY